MTYLVSCPTWQAAKIVYVDELKPDLQLPADLAADTPVRNDSSQAISKEDSAEAATMATMASQPIRSLTNEELRFMPDSQLLAWKRAGDSVVD